MTLDRTTWVNTRYGIITDFMGLKHATISENSKLVVVLVDMKRYYGTIIGKFDNKI